MSDYVKKYTCGTCAEFEFEGNDRKGYCRRYGQYYWDNDSCKHWEEAEGRTESSGSVCFLTTACCQYKGLPDDCRELTILRKFRDEHLLNTEDGKRLVEEYYRIAPEIVDKILCHPEKENILETIYSKICEVINLIEVANFDDAILAYKEMVLDVQKELED